MKPITRIKVFDFLFSALIPACVILFVFGVAHQAATLAMTASVMIPVVMVIYSVGYTPLYRPTFLSTGNVSGVPIPKAAGAFAVGFMSTMFLTVVLIGAGISIGIAVWAAQPWYIGVGVFFSAWSCWLCVRHPMDRLQALLLSDDRAQRRLNEISAAEQDALKSVTKPR